MSIYKIKFDSASEPIEVQSGSLISEAARLAGVEITQPCGGQGRCGRCAVNVLSGTVRRRSVLRLSKTDIEKGLALACQTVIESDLSVSVPPQEKIERILTTDKTVSEIQVPANYDAASVQSIRRIYTEMTPPNMEDQTDDTNRLKAAIRRDHGFQDIDISLNQYRQIGDILRSANWKVTAILDADSFGRNGDECARLIDLIPGQVKKDTPLWGVAIDIGTTTVTVWLVDLLNGKVTAQLSEYNQQITRGEDIISRIVYSTKENGAQELRSLVLTTINELIDTACKRIKGGSCSPSGIVKATISGNSTMMHLFLGIPAISIRLSPFVTAVNELPFFTSREVGLNIHPEATIICLPGVASYVGSDITAGVYSSGMDDTSKTTLFMDVGTNGEIVLGSNEWLVTCACSAGPAFEGAGVLDGMRATKGAIEEVWINGTTLDPTIRVIGGIKPSGICGSGLISLLAEMFMTGIVDKAGNIKSGLNTARVREGEHGMEYVVVWKDQSQTNNDIVITAVDIDNLIRAKGAIFAGYQVLAQGVGVPLEVTEQMLIGGSFGKYINIEKAIEIGLLPDMPWERFNFLGNTSVKGSYYALLDSKALKRIQNIANRMTYIELSADNTFYEAFMSALFLPHTDLTLFPTVMKTREEINKT